MVKVSQVAPTPGRVARFASGRLACGIQNLHARRKLPFMRIGVTGSAVQVVEVKRRCAPAGHRLVAIDTRHRYVSSGQNKACLLVTRYVKRSAVKRGLVVASLAAVEVRGPGKLVTMNVLVASDASGGLYPEHSRSTRRYMTLGAGHVGMFSAQGEVGLRVVGNRELRRLETLQRVA